MLTIQRTERGKAEPLRQAKERAQARVGAVTSALREKFLTNISGQEITYKEKELQALAYLALPVEPDPSDPVAQVNYGFIFGEVGITGETPNQVAQVVAYKAGLMLHLGPMIERLRLQVAVDLTVAADEAEMIEIVDLYEDDLGAIANG